ncbi:MAG TPA: POTRA domain-containing protein [Verrucomicrobiae bacterium]|nr:POTRA domain-containing protein [Verrucomicrobiae bacterium]
MRERHRVMLPLLIFYCCFCGTPLTGSATESAAGPAAPVPPVTNTTPHFFVRGYTVEGVLLSTNILVPLFSKYTGTNVSLQEVIKAASDLQLAYRNQGYPAMSVAFVPEQIADGIVTFNVAQTAIPQIVVAGERYLSFSNGLEVVSRPPVAAVKPPTTAGVITNIVPPIHPNPVPPKARVETRRATYPEMVNALAAMRLEMGKLETQAKDTRVHVVSTNAGPRFAVEKYLVNGNTILPSAAIGQVITNIDGAFGTNVGFDGVQTVVSELGKAYHERGFVTVAVNVPQQKLTNATVKLEVREGRLADIKMAGNRYFSSNNVMRSLPSLHTNMVLNGPIFNAELNRANANQDRQIYPVIGPGLEPGSSELTLNVKDRVPLHTKLELNNQNSPGTPDMRVNGSAVYDNLWQREHSLGVQYGFSPEVYKQGNRWDWYDQPLVAYYSAFYRLPLGNPEPIANMVANNPGSFGYNEATRQFDLPPPSGQSELTLYANRATIDTGVENLGNSLISSLTSSNGSVTLSQQNIHQDITINEGLGFQLTRPLPEMNGIRSILSGGLDYKAYSLTSYGTNIFTTTTVITNNGQVNTTAQSVINVTPPTYSTLDYLPLSLNYSAGLQDAFGPANWGLGLSADLWYSSLFSTTSTSTNNITTTTSSHGDAALANITGSSKSTGHWVILRPSFSQEIDFYTNWVTTFHADGQWASEPLISVEQFGAGGVNSVRGYHEGEVFGDTGWHLSLDQQTPPYIVGMIRDGTPLTVRGSAYMDYARVYLLDPQGRQGSTPLWGTGFGFSASAGSHWQAQFLFSWPLLSAGTVPAYKPFFNFALTAQF